MTTRAVFSEHDSEPVRGLPAVLPEGERVLWQGAPNWRSLALNTYQVRTLAYYFGAMVLARGIYLLSTGSSIGDALQGCVGPAVFSLIGLGLLTGVAALAARSTLYTITNRRIVLRQGIALSSSLRSEEVV